MRKKLVILLSLTFALNSYFLASASEIINSASFENAVMAQSAVMDVSFGIFLPLKLVGTVVHEGSPLPGTPSSDEHGKKDSGKAASAADFVILPVREDLRGIQHIGNCTEFLGTTCPIAIAAPVYIGLLQDTGMGAAVFLMLLIYIICLSLSNLPLPVFAHAYIRTRLECVLQPGFYFIRNNYYLSGSICGGNHVS